VVPYPETRLAQAVTIQGPLERIGPPRTTIDSAIFAHRTQGEGINRDRELSLRDLVTDMRSDVYGPGEICAGGDEGKGTCDIDQLGLRELAQELGEEAPRASAPGGPPRKTIDSGIFARRTEGEGMNRDRELSLRDLAVDMPSDVYGTGETCADRDEGKGTCDIDELGLRELAQELDEEAP
jgi:hypothetical protein